MADSPANLTGFTKQRGGPCGGSSYPALRLVALVACGTRSIIDAVFGPTSHGETTHAWRLVSAAQAGMVILADRNFAAGKLFAAFADTKAHLLVRAKTGAGGPHLPVLCRHRDGSYASVFGGVLVRVVEAEITITTTTGPVTGVYRLLTTLRDPRRHPAGALIRLYHERWEIETAYLELKPSILGGRVLRARTPAGVAQEVYALLVTYQILRTAMTDATNTVTGVDSDRAGFSTALHAARDQVVKAAGVIAESVIDLAGAIGRLVLDNLLPTRRLRLNARTVKATLAITVLAGPGLTTGPEP